MTVQLEGAKLRDRILERWGSKVALEQEADARNEQAAEDLFTLERLEEDPDRLDARHERTTVTALEPSQLSRLTPKRLELVDRIAASREPMNVSELARDLDRDKKNVGEAAELLEELGLVERVADGRAKRVRLKGSTISIEIAPDTSMETTPPV